MSSHNNTFEAQDEFFTEDIPEYSRLAYSQCSLFKLEPLDLSMPKHWFPDGVDYPFIEVVSFTNVMIFL